MWEKERAIRFVEKNERLGKMVADLSSGFYERLYTGWHELTLDNPLNTEEGYHFSIYCREVLLPQLVENADQNKLRIAYLLCFINSKEIKQELKNKLRIREVTDFQREYQVPSLFKCNSKKWGWQCDNMNRYWDEIRTVMEVGVSSKDEVYNRGVNLFEFCGCMVGKRFSLVSGYCFQTTEFPQSGAIFVEGVNYILRSDGAMIMVSDVGDGKKVSEVEIIDGVADMHLMGGVWQPTRCLNQGIRC